MKFTLRVAVLALSAYGAWSLYETYGDRLRSTLGSVDDFAEDAKRSTSAGADKVSSAVGDAAEAIVESASDITKAASDAEDSVSRTLRDPRAVST